jgi:hypothetical protein
VEEDSAPVQQEQLSGKSERGSIYTANNLCSVIWSKVSFRACNSSLTVISIRQSVSRKAVVSMAPSVSSVYSQPSGFGYSEQNPNRNTMASSVYDDISPPDSPIYGTRNAAGDVSPIEPSSDNDIHPAYRVNKAAVGSSIPVLRKATPSETAAGKVANRAYKRDMTVPLRWDKYSGEPTTNKSRGLPSTVKPENVIQQVKLRSTSVKSSASSKDEAAMIDTRPPWKGASGRTAIVAPVVDQPGQTAPLPRREIVQPATYGIPSPPLKSPIQGPREMPSANTLKQADYTEAAPMTPRNPSFSSRPSTAHTVERTDSNVRQSEDELHATPDKNESENPTDRGSRFSWTTQATNTTYKQSPPSSPEDAPPVPRIPASQYNDGTIMSRSRPLTSRKNQYSPSDSPTDSPIESRRPSDFLSVGISNSLTRGPSVRSPSIASGSTAPQKGPDKALPPTPQELGSADHLSVLQAQLDDLNRQRRNVERLISDLTRPEASNPLNTNFKIEREREKRVAALKGELMEIEMAKHDIGLRLHRANRRQEREQGYEGFTTLWVRRVTS